MKYINAKDILPNALVKELQNYIQGGYIYVPTNPIASKEMGRDFWLSTRIATTKPTDYRGIPKRDPLLKNYLKSISCLYMPFVKLFIRNKFAGGELPPAFCYTEIDSVPFSR